MVEKYNNLKILQEKQLFLLNFHKTHNSKLVEKMYLWKRLKVNELRNLEDKT